MNKQCSWCKRWLIGGKWTVIMPKYWPENEPVSHGMCDDCYAANRKLDEKLKP